MADYQPTTTQSNSSSSIGYLNPKVMEKKLQQQDDWAKLAKQQAVINEKMTEQEKLQKQQQKTELENNLFWMIQQKQSSKKHFDYNQRIKDYTEVKASQEEYENQVRRAREDRNEVKKILASELAKEIQFKEHERKRRLNNEKQVEQNIIQDALDDLRKDNLAKIQKKNNINQTFNQHIHDRQEERRRKHEQDQLEKEIERKNVNKMTYLEQNRMSTHMMHFQNFLERQKKMGEIYINTVGNDQKEREQQLNAYISKGIQNDNKRAEAEEVQRRLKKDYQTRSLSENVQLKMQEREEQQFKQRNSTKALADQAAVDNYYFEDYNKKLKQFKANQAHVYKNDLDNQVKEADERRLRASHEMSESEKKRHFNHADNILAKVNERSSNIPIKARPLENSHVNFDEPNFVRAGYKNHVRNNLSLNASSVADLRGREGNMSVNASPINQQPQVFQNGYITPNVRASYDNLMNIQNISGKRVMPQSSIYNPITNPAPTVKKPYLNIEHMKEYQAKSMGYYQNNNNLIGNKSFV